jgi:translation elongation factor EF-1beta
LQKFHHLSTKNDLQNLTVSSIFPLQRSYAIMAASGSSIAAPAAAAAVPVAAVAAAAAVATSSAAAAPAADDLDDMFGDGGDDDETPEERAATVARQARMALAKKLKDEKDAKDGKGGAKKDKPAEKSLVVLEVKPWEADTNLEEVWKMICSTQQEGLVWGQTFKLEPVAYGIMKLVMTCTIVDSLVLMDDVTDKIEAIEEFVQSVQVASMNKI